MRNEKENIPRLLILAEHLKSPTIKAKYKENQMLQSHTKICLMIGSNGNLYYLFPFVVEELPLVFNEWQLSERGQIVYLKDPKLVNNYAILEFFGLEIWPLLHCFSIGNQLVNKFGGSVLTRFSKPKEVAENILRYLEILPNYEHEVKMYFTRRVLVEKINLNQFNSPKPKKKDNYEKL